MKIFLQKFSSVALISIIININVFLQRVHATYYCNLGSSDPCMIALAMYDPYARTGNCEYNGVYAPCDRYIVPGWYKSDDLVLDQCPTLNSCGAVYPIWMNGSFPLVADGVVSRTLCKTGFEGCCVRQYDLQIKNCGNSYVYCLPALDSCPERFCFGSNGTCIYPTSPSAATTKGQEIVPLTKYNDLESRYTVTIAVVIVLVSVLIVIAICLTVRYIRKKKKEREIGQSKAELINDGTSSDLQNHIKKI